MKYPCIICLILLSLLTEPLFADVLLVQLSQNNNTLVVDNIRRGEGSVKPAIRHGGNDYLYRCLSADGLVLEEGSFDFPTAPLPLNPAEPFRQTILLQIPWQDDFETFDCFSVKIPYTQTNQQGLREKLISFKIAEAIVNSRQNIQLETTYKWQQNSQPQSVKLIGNGPDDNRLIFVFVGDGYTESEQEQYKLDVENSINQILLFEPWADYADLINVYYIENTISNESGIGIDSPRDTIFRLYYYYGLSYRLIWSPESTGLITDFLAQYAPASFDFAFVIANDASGAGGSGGLYPIFNLHTYSIEIAVHEFGHSFAYLADEYVQESIADRYTYSESFPNVMEHLSRDLSMSSYDDIPWGMWIEPGVVFPGGGSNGIGLFEGAFYHAQGYYRPQYNCLMRGYGVGFCEVCAEAHVVRLYDFVSPIDSVSPGRSSLTITDQTPIDFSVDLSQDFNPNIQIRWFMNDQLIGRDTHIRIDPSIYSPMTADLLVEVTDTSDWIRHDPFINGSYNPNTKRGVHIASENKVTDSFEWHILFETSDFQEPKIIYVDDDATGTSNGTSWVNAYTFLQDALADANESDKPVEIRVASGTYTPDKGGGQTTGDRKATFRLINGVTLAGGYAGSADPNARNIELYETILSSDLNGDDVELYNALNTTRAENSYHVVISNGTNNSATIDGFTITGGNDDRTEYVYDSTPVPMLTLIGYGAGLYNINGSPTIINCTFRSNYANAGGSGMFNGDNSNPALMNCTFNRNVGSGMFNGESNPVLTNCTFDNNQGSGMINRESNPILSKCTFSANESFGGGGMHNFHDSKPILTNCTFSCNSAAQGGGMLNRGSSPILNNCTFSGNSAADDGGGMYNLGDSPILTNCIVWGNSPDQIYGDSIVTYSNIQGGWEGEGNIDEDPLFVNPGYWADANNTNIIAELNDPNAIWSDGDYHLKSQVGRWYPVSQNWIIDDVTSPCIDAGDLNMPVGEEPEPNGGRINIGAYGGTAEASKSY